MSIHPTRSFTLPLLLAGLFLVSASTQAAGRGAQDDRSQDESHKVLIDAIAEIHAQRTQLLTSDAVPGDLPQAGRMEDLLPVATGSAAERSAEFLTRVGKHGMSIDVDFSRRIEALMPEWLIAPQTLTSAEQTAKAHLLLNELQTVFAESVALQHALQSHITDQLDAIWRDEPSHAQFITGFAKGRAKLQPIIDELQANRRRLVKSFRNLLEFADSRRDTIAWDEEAGRLLVESDEDVIVYNELVEKLQKASAQEETIFVLLMAEMGTSIKQAQKAE